MLEKNQKNTGHATDRSDTQNDENHSISIDDLRWNAVVARDVAADGSFWSCVRTTKIYCRPSCAARPLRKNVFFVDDRAEAETLGFRACKRCVPDRWVGGTMAQRIGAMDWQGVGDGLSEKGWMSLGALLSDSECTSMISGYGEDETFRSTISMNRHGFGAGEYRYYGEAVPDLLSQLRQLLYEQLVPAANTWSQQMGVEPAWPSCHREFREICAKAGQMRPTPLILKYGPGDYNRLHRDLYGEVIFPYQVAILLSEPGKDFDGGEFVLTEQRPRMQSRAEVVPLRRGDAIVFAVNQRPVQGVKGIYRASMRHGVSTIRSGERYTLGMIFHDAA